MESLPNTRSADAQNPNSPADVTSSTGPPSAASTRKTSPASSIHYATSTTSSPKPMKMPSVSSDRKQLDMDSSEDKSWADKQAARDGEAKMLNAHVPAQDNDGSASLSPGEFTSNSNHNVGHASNQWHSVAAQDMISVGNLRRGGNQSRNAIDHLNARAAQTFGNALGLGNRNNTPTGGSLGNSGKLYNVLGHQDAAGHFRNVIGHQNHSVSGGIGIPGRSFHTLPSQEATHPHDTHENTSAAQNLHDIQRNVNDARRDNFMGSPCLEGTPGTRNLCVGFPETDNTKRERQGNVPQPPNVHSTEGEGHLAPWISWNPSNTNEHVSAARDVYNDPLKVYDAGREHQLPPQDLLAAQTFHNSQGDVLLARGDNLPIRDVCHGSSNVYMARGHGRKIHNSHQSPLAAQYQYEAPPGGCDAGGQGHPPPQRTLSGQDLNDNQKNILTTQSLHNAPSVCDAEGRGGQAPQNLYDAHSNILGPRNFRRSAPPNVCDESSRLFIKAGSSDRFVRCLPTFHNPSVTSTSSLSANTPAANRDLPTSNNYNSSNNNTNFSATAPGFFSSISTSFFGSNAPSPSVSNTPYVSITSPSSTHLSRTNANNNVALRQQSEPFADPSSTISTTSSSSNTCTAAMFPPSGIVISDADMERAMAYCYDRGNGQYTRLVPVDVLPFSLRDLPARVTSDAGMIVLPVPRMVGADGQPANVQLVPHVSGSNVTPPISPTGPAQGGSNDIIQNRIDNIVAAAPNATSGPVVLARSTAAANGSGRREKIYCDKWIHDGTCAFTQQGCKFKHEMPMDKETQQSLGLFHGLPAWYRKQEAERVMHLDDRPVPLGGGAVAYYGGPAAGRFGNNGGAFGVGAGTASRVQSWRRIEAAPPTPAATGDEDGSSPLSGGSGSRGGAYGRGRNGSRVANYRANNNFGPIGPPSQSSGALSGGFGGSRRHTNTLAGGDVFPSGESSAREAQRDDAAPRGGVRIANNPFDALEDYGSASNTSSDNSRGPEKEPDFIEKQGKNEAPH